MFRTVALCIMVASLSAAGAVARWRDDPEHRRDDVLVSQLHERNRIAMDLCWTMLQQATSADGRQVAQQIFDDHLNEDRRLIDFARDHYIDPRVVTPPSALHVDVNGAADQLASLSGDDLDRAFASVMVDLHKDTLRLLEAARPAVADGQTLELVDHQVALVRAELALADRMQRQEQRPRR